VSTFRGTLPFTKTRFFGHFNTYLYKLVSDLPSLLLATRSVLEAFQEDGVVYFELRTTPRRIGDHDEESTIRAISEVIAEWNEAEPMKTSLILSIDQAKHSSAQAIRIVDLATRLRDEGLPVVGVDLCGDPHRTEDMTIFREAFRLAKERELGITLHFAEVPHSSSPQVLDEMLSWIPDRLGHVIHVPLEMRKEIIKRNISVELCLTCNVLAGMLPGKAGFEQHHFRDWWKGGARVSLGTDDVGVFGSMPSEEYLLAAKHFGLSRRDLVALSRGALKGAFGRTAEFETVLQRFEAAQEL
jgi:adenosine deaminase